MFQFIKSPLTAGKEKALVVILEPVSFSPSVAASSAFFPLFILDVALTANTPRRHTARTHNTTQAAGEKED